MEKFPSTKNITDKFCIHPRAVAMIMRYNKDPITFPCYKVIANSGKISGYNTKCGVPEKIQKLQQEGIEIHNGIISKKFIIDVQNNSQPTSPVALIVNI